MTATIKLVTENCRSGQFLCTLPKKWCEENEIDKNSFVRIEKFTHPLRQTLEKYQGSNAVINLIGKNGERRQGKIIGFVREFVMLHNGQVVDLDWIFEVTES